MSRGEIVQVPDDAHFTSFREQCERHEGWTVQYSKGVTTVWNRRPEENKTVQKLKVKGTGLLEAKTAPAAREETFKCLFQMNATYQASRA